MSNNINRIRKNKLKGTGIFAAAALTAALIAGNNIPGVTRQVSAAESCLTGEYCVFSDSGQHHT